MYMRTCVINNNNNILKFSKILSDTLGPFQVKQGSFFKSGNILILLPDRSSDCSFFSANISGGRNDNRFPEIFRSVRFCSLPI